jgi:2-keto-3-deoxy-L-rhamnonate aldolase RhmA
MTKLRGIWDAGRASLNGWCSIGNAFTAEIMAAGGFDSITVDMQHGALDYTDLLPMLQAMRASGATLLARVPWLDPGQVMKALDAGCEGVICPMARRKRPRGWSASCGTRRTGCGATGRRGRPLPMGRITWSGRASGSWPLP